MANAPYHWSVYADELSSLRDRLANLEEATAYYATKRHIPGGGKVAPDFAGQINDVKQRIADKEAEIRQYWPDANI